MTYLRIVSDHPVVDHGLKLKALGLLPENALKGEGLSLLVEAPVDPKENGELLFCENAPNGDGATFDADLKPVVVSVLALEGSAANAPNDGELPFVVMEPNSVFFVSPTEFDPPNAAVVGMPGVAFAFDVPLPNTPKPVVFCDLSLVLVPNAVEDGFAPPSDDVAPNREVEPDPPPAPVDGALLPNPPNAGDIED